MNKILIIASHPDDEVLGCGSTIAKYANNNEIYVATLGEGISSRYTKRDKINQNEILELQNQCRNVGQILGVKENFFFNLPDNQFDTIPFLEIVKIIEHIIIKIKPSKIYTHFSEDLNIDHQITFKAVITATRPMENCPVKEIYSFEVPSSTEWNFGNSKKQFSPNVFEDILGYFQIKIKALQEYKGEIREYPHPRSPEALKIIAQRWGMIVNKKLVEPFELIRKIID